MIFRTKEWGDAKTFLIDTLDKENKQRLYGIGFDECDWRMIRECENFNKSQMIDYLKKNKIKYKEGYLTHWDYGDCTQDGFIVNHGYYENVYFDTHKEEKRIGNPLQNKNDDPDAIVW